MGLLLVPNRIREAEKQGQGWLSGLKQFFSLDRRFVARRRARLLLIPLLFSALHIFLSLLFSGSAGGMMALLTLLP